MKRRNLQNHVELAMTDTPVIFLNGARQTGKSTLAKDITGSSYYTMDDATTLAAATADPQGFLAGLPPRAVLDEVQRAPQLFPAIKLLVDRDRQPGRYLLTGSADVLLLPNISESLAGRMEIVTLWPFSAGELENRRENFVDALFGGGDFAVESPETKDAITQRVITGGYPETVTRGGQERRAAWFESYIMAILQRDVRDIANIEHLAAMPRLLALLAARTATLVNYSEISRSLGMPMSTVKRYMALLEMTFLVRTLPPWSANLGKRLVKSSKLVLCDTGLTAHLLGITNTSAASSKALGPMLENFVIMELMKQLGWSRTRAKLYHFREQSGGEIDLVLETPSGQVAGIEVKSSATVTAADFKQLRYLQGKLGDNFSAGVVLYTGTEAVSFGDRLHALPLCALWQTGVPNAG